MPMTKTKIKQYAVREFTIDGVDEATRTANLTCMTDKPCDNWFVPESCICEKECVDLKRFRNGVMPLLFNHNRDYVLGQIQDVNFGEGRVRCKAKFDEDEEADKIFKKVKSGSIKGVSIGYRRKHTVRVEAGCEYRGKKYEERTDVTDKWEPYEVSIVSCPADPDCGVGRELKDLEMEIEEHKEEKEMGEDKNKTTATPAPAAGDSSKQAVNTEDAARAAAAAERQRTIGIMTLCRKFNVAPEKVDDYLKDEKCTVDKVRKDILDEMAENQKPAKVTVTQDAGDKFIERAVDGLAVHYGVIEEKDAVKGANEYRNGSLRTIAEDCLLAGGDVSERELRHMSSVDLFNRLFSGHTRAMGSEQFASVIDQFSNKTMQQGYKEQPTVFQHLVSRGSNKDFKPTHKYRLGFDGEPELMPPESGEFKYQEMKDSKISTEIHTYGKAISFTREIFINDDMGSVVKAISMQSGGFRRLQERLFFEMLVSGITYSSDNGNLVLVTKNISTKAYAEMRKLMHKQKDEEEKAYIGVFPAFLVASDDYAMEHEQLLVSLSDPAQNNANVANIMRDKMKLITTPYLEGKPYYTVAAPKQMAGIEYTVLNNVDRPLSRIVIPQSHLGIDYQYYMDFGFNKLNDKAFCKNDGSAIS